MDTFDKPSLVNELKQFVRDWFDDYDLYRGKKSYHSKEWNFKNIDEFYSFNDKIIDELPMENLLKNKSLNIMDKEYMSSWDASGFCWNRKGEFVIFHEK